MRAQNYIKGMPTKNDKNRRKGADINRRDIEVVRTAIEVLSVAVQAMEMVDAWHVDFGIKGIDFFEEVYRFEIHMITQALERAKGSQTRAARLLGMNLTTLNTKIKAYKIDWKPEPFE